MVGSMPSLAEQAADAFGLVEADLDRRQPAGRKQPADLGRKPAIFVEPVGPGEQSLGGSYSADPRASFGRLRDIGRVAEDQVERSLDALGPIADAERRPGRPSRAARHCAGHSRAPLRMNRCRARSPWAIVERGEQQGARPGAKVEDRARGLRSRQNARPPQRSRSRCRAAGPARPARPPGRSSRRRAGR